MKKRILLLTIIALLLPAAALAAGTVTVTLAGTRDSHRWVKFTCVGDASNGTIPATTLTTEEMRWLLEDGRYPYRLIVNNDSSWTGVTDNSDVYLKDAGGHDFLNGQGVDQLDDDTYNYIRLTQYDPIIEALIFSVANQATASGAYTVVVVFTK